jgi:H+/gluconate symporter-like permease
MTYEWFEFIGHPFTAILVACLVAIYGLAVRQGMAKDRVMEICGHALQPAGIILLVIGAGGGGAYYSGLRDSCLPDGCRPGDAGYRTTAL